MHESGENYLETILILKERKGTVRSIVIARELNFSKPSVSRAMGILREDGFIEMECDYCKNRFMLHYQVYESEDNINFFCPICGLPNRTNTFFVPEVLEKAQQIALNYMYDEINRTLGKSLKQINKKVKARCPYPIVSKS